jgi:hypothetical protein
MNAEERCAKDKENVFDVFSHSNLFLELCQEILTKKTALVKKP